MSLSPPPSPSSTPFQLEEKESPSQPEGLKRLEPVYLLYDERMLQHRPVGWVEPDEYPEDLDEVDDDDEYQLENPERLRVIYNRLTDLERRLLYEEEDLRWRREACVGYWTGAGKSTDTGTNGNERVVFKRLACEMATKEQILLAHSEEQYDRLDSMRHWSDKELLALSKANRNDMYYCRESFNAARLAAGGLLACVDAVCSPSVISPTMTTEAAAVGPGSSQIGSSGIVLPSKGSTCSRTNKALALVRPPGHHACQSKEMGFCFIDSVVVAAKYALATHSETIKRVAILDWDVHDGNGTTEGTIRDENILRIDIHRYGIYPFTGPPSEIGTGKARGMNINVAWSCGGMGNTEYAAALHEFVLPLLASYQPDLLLISCGLDAAMGDLIGGCELTPGFYHAMTRAAIEVVGGLNGTTPVVCALEGGYTMNVIPDCMEAVTLAMLHCSYRYHSAFLSEGLCGAAEEKEEEERTTTKPWPPSNENGNIDTLDRSRRTLSNYYIHCDRCTGLIDSARQDLNRCIRIFKGIDRWKHLNLERIKGPPREAVILQNSTSNKRSWAEMSVGNGGVGGGGNLQDGATRPRIYLWYGMEKHHQKFLSWNHYAPWPKSL